MYEFAHRTTSGSPVLDSTSTIYTGSAFNWQTGILNRKNWEVAFRYTVLIPEKATGLNQIQEFTLAVSKYIVGQSLKVQGDISYREEATKNGIILGRLQTEISF